MYLLLFISGEHFRMTPEVETAFTITIAVNYDPEFSPAQTLPRFTFGNCRIPNEYS